MSNTNSLAWPMMFDVARNKVAVLEDSVSVVNRSKLLILTEPTELYNNINQGVGLKKYLWQYNTDNIKAIIQDRIKDQLRIHEPCVDADATSFADGLLFTGSADEDTMKFNQLKMTVGLQTTFKDKTMLTIDMESEFQNLFY